MCKALNGTEPESGTHRSVNHYTEIDVMKERHLLDILFITRNKNNEIRDTC